MLFGIGNTRKFRIKTTDVLTDVDLIPSGDNQTSLGRSNARWSDLYSVDANISGDLDVDGHTNLDNVSVAGVSTFTGLIDADGGIKVDDYIEIFHYGGSNFIRPSNGALDIITSGSTYTSDKSAGGVDLYFNGTKRIETENTGAIVSGIMTATGRVGVGTNTTAERNALPAPKQDI